MSPIPYVTAWAGENPMAPLPVALYGVVLLLCSISFMLLSWRLQAQADGGPAMARDARKNRLSILLHALAIGLSLGYPPLGAAIHVLLALLWLMPQACPPRGPRHA